MCGVNKKMVNQRRLQGIINSNKRRLLAPLQRRHNNAVYLNTHNTLEHELKKCELAYHLQTNGHTFITEVRLNNGKIPDVLVIDITNPIAYEVIKTETEASIKLKHKNYQGIQVIPVEATPMGKVDFDSPLSQ